MGSWKCPVCGSTQKRERLHLQQRIFQHPTTPYEAQVRSVFTFEENASCCPNCKVIFALPFEGEKHV